MAASHLFYTNPVSPYFPLLGINRVPNRELPIGTKMLFRLL